MNCPMQTKKTNHYCSSHPNPTHQTIDFFDCVQKECAWWFGAQECCALVAIANSLHKEDK